MLRFSMVIVFDTVFAPLAEPFIFKLKAVSANIVDLSTKAAASTWSQGCPAPLPSVIVLCFLLQPTISSLNTVLSES